MNGNGQDGAYLRTHGDLGRWTPRGQVRHWVLDGLSLFGGLSRDFRGDGGRNRIQFLYLHAVFEDQREAFRELLSDLARDYTFISHSAAVSRILKGEIDRPYVAFSFDDGFKNCLGAAEDLSAFGASGCFFVCPDIVGVTDYSAIRAFCATRLHMPPVEFMNWEDLEELLLRGHEVGSHSLGHPVLETVSRQQLQNELGASREILEARLGPVHHFAWPYGRFHHFTPEAAGEVFAAGYTSCASAERGCHVGSEPVAAQDLCIRRDQVKPSWPLRHIRYFLWLNARRVVRQKDGWPDAWGRLPSAMEPPGS